MPVCCQKILMKTNKVMVRPMGSFDVKQRTKDGMFNATELVKRWNLVKTKGRKDVSNFLQNKRVKEFIQALSEEEDTDTRNLVSITKGKNQGTWMNPYLFLKFAMWVDPKFEVKVIKFVYDQLIQFRHDAGDNYRKLASSASILPGVDYSRLAKALNWIVFGKHDNDLRQLASEEQLKELAEIQKQISFSIDMGMINDFTQLLALMRRMYHQKHNKAA